ncbi:MAG: hypothetical protein H7A49_08540 [Akkermansiaceae bacterium]|nr:hypothetical protein [Akkermansiaceae bacterium]MCP5543940.1 hypothetical protein [Akkermansiaceae bacterium]MCP5547572.1 hypothetical protein [Akkermansiaceae bacterium]
MGSKDIQRSIRTIQNARSEGDAPNIGRVSRMPGTGMPTSGRRRRRSFRSAHKDDRRKMKVMKAWLLVLSAAAMAMLVLTIVAAVRSQQRKGPKPLEVGGGTGKPVLKRVESKFPSPSSEEAEAIVRRGIAVRDEAEVKDLFRLGMTTPGEAVERLEEIAARSGGVAGMQWLSSIDANGMLIDAVLVGYEKMDLASQRLALLTPDENGVWKVDFDAFARTTEPSWEKIVEGGAKEAVVRVLVAKDSYYNGPFADEDEWTCYGLASPDAPEMLLGYCRKDSAQAKAMRRILRDDETLSAGGQARNVRATLKLRRLAGAENRQFMIERVMAEDWVVAEPWYDERFE